MAEQKRFPVSAHQWRRLESLDADAANIERLKQECVRAIIAAHEDPVMFTNWDIAVSPTEIVVTCPIAPPSDTGPALVA